MASRLDESGMDYESLIDSAWFDIFGQIPAGDADFFDSGGTSLQLVSLAAKLQQLSGLRVDILELIDVRTPAGQVELLRTKAKPRPGPRPPQP